MPRSASFHEPMLSERVLNMHLRSSQWRLPMNIRSAKVKPIRAQAGVEIGSWAIQLRGVRIGGESVARLLGQRTSLITNQIRCNRSSALVFDAFSPSTTEPY
ncbi:hypothetical protein N7G274_010389 [Stereocaulon virgatum]|uniref:Uncharacterized protein n=1 Tax=Stereocaulon virgatum TaxID=373712 RepID=A0ABR3ZW15_9LECA